MHLSTNNIWINFYVSLKRCGECTASVKQGRTLHNTYEHKQVQADHKPKLIETVIEVDVGLIEVKHSQNPKLY